MRITYRGITDEQTSQMNIPLNIIARVEKIKNMVGRSADGYARIDRIIDDPSR